MPRYVNVRLLTRASFRHLTGHRLQLLLSVLGVALGVAVVLSIDVAIESARAGFQVSAETVAGRATHTVTSERGSVDEALFTRVRTELDVPMAAPVVEGFATSPRVPARALRILGIDPFSEGPFRSFVSGGSSGAGGSFVAGGSSGAEVSAFMTTRLGVAISAGLAAEAGVAPGDTLPIMTEGQERRLPVVAVVEPADDLTRAGLSDVLLMDVAGAQEVLRMPGRLSRIDLRVAEDDGRTIDGIRAALPSNVIIEESGARGRAMTGMIDAFDVNLTALSLLALVFGMFLIYNAVTFSVVQRREILGRLRTLGVTRGEIVRMILLEAWWVGLVGAALGAVAGIVLARGLVGMVSRTINDLYFVVTVQSVAVEPALLVKAIVLGVAATMLAALAPALEAAGANPRLASLRSVMESRARRRVPRVAGLGALSCLAGAAILLVPTTSLAVSFTALFLMITGMALVTPAATLVMVASVLPLLRKSAGTIGVMAVRGVGTSLSRTAPAIAALVVAVSVTVGLGVMIESFRGTLTRWLDGTLRADVYVSLPGPRATAATGTLWPPLVRAFVAHPAVAGHTTYRTVDIVRDSDRFRLVALDLDPRGEAAFSFVDGRAEPIMASFRAGEGVLVSEPYANRRNVGVGDHVRLAAQDEAVELPIVGVFYDYGSEQGTVMMARSLYDSVYEDAGVTSLALFLVPGADSEALVSELLSIVPPGRAVVARPNAALRAASLDVFDRTFRVTAVLRMLAFIVAFVGVLSALAALQLERARELGLMRAAGMTPGQLWGLVMGQTGLIGLAAGVLAIPMGLVLSIVMIFVVNKRSFGWTLDMQVGPEVLVQAVGLAIAGAVLAGLYPAWRMASTPPALALRGEE